jgi:hypothetical protein
MNAHDDWLSGLYSSRSPSTSLSDSLLGLERYEVEWAVAFLKTELIEVMFGALILIILSRRGLVETSHVTARQMILILMTASAITHPPLWFILPHLFDMFAIKSYLAYLIVGETLVTLVEAWWYREMLTRQLKYRWLSAILFSITLNSISALYGLYESELLRMIK